MLRDYQQRLARELVEILHNIRIGYCAMEMRVGKTLIALRAAELLGVERVLFATKKKAIASVRGDFSRENFKFKLDVTNYEQLDKFNADYDLIVADESHLLGSFPRPSLRTRRLKKIVKDNYLILLSGTPTPECDAQIYHQFWISASSPFEEKTFYKWSKNYLDVQQRIINGMRFNDYKGAAADARAIREKITPHLLTFTQSDAGFAQKNIIEKIIHVDMIPATMRLVEHLAKVRVYYFKNGDDMIVCDTAVKLQSKIHQICSGTIKTENGARRILDDSKARYIANNYNNQKIAIFYKFIAEGELLRKTIPNATDNPERFNAVPGAAFVSQIQSGSMGVNLSSADVLIFYNIDFSAVQYWQARARLQSLDRAKPALVHWLFSRGGIEDKIYAAVLKKRNYTLKYFREDFLNGIENTKKNNRLSATRA